MDTRITAIETYLHTLQARICRSLEEIDQQHTFQQDHWQYHQGQGGGKTCVLTQGRVFEKAGVNFSHIQGEQLPKAATTQRPELANRSFQAIGLSLVIHPDNPFIPTTHMNIRCFMAFHPTEAPVWWFGGGYDLTPYYPFDEDCRHWHETAKMACESYGDNVYAEYKKWCDDYFYLKHRQETRGIGGLFFDDLNQWDFETCFDFMRAIGDSFLLAYIPIVNRRKTHAFTPEQKQFQRYRRGRYVEFNLLYDRGTLFGIQSGGRTESILMSLPPQVEWHYQYQVEPNSLEARLQDYLKPREWC